jgi:peroxiredoxin
MQDRRILIPIAAAILLAAVCAWRVFTNKPQDYADQVAKAVMMRPVAAFEVLDSDNHLVRLGTFLGRHQIILLFVDDALGVDKDPELLRLRERFAELQARQIKVIAISGAIPQQNRAAIEKAGGFPFPLVSDFDPLSPEGTLRIHRQWGRLKETGETRPGVFLVDRKGQVLSTPEGPKPWKTVDAAVEKALK